MILILFVFLFGCAVIPTNNIPEYKEVEQPKIEKNERKDISFSVNVYGGGDFFAKQDMIDNIKTKLKETGLFKKITYSSEPYEDIHYNFEFKKTIYSNFDAFAVVMVESYSLFLIPAWVKHYVDSTMFVTKNGKEIYSASVPAKITVVMWAPLLVLSPIFNTATVDNYMIKKHLNYYVNEIIDNKLY